MRGGGGGGRGGSQQTEQKTPRVRPCCWLKFRRIQVRALQQLHCTVSLINARHEAYGSAESKIKTMSEAGTKAARSHVSPCRSLLTLASRQRQRHVTSIRGHNGSFPEFSEAHTTAASIFLLHLGSSFPPLSRSLSPSDNYFSIPS